MTRLESRYRLLLRLLPAWYRAEREDEMVATFLADRDSGPEDDSDPEGDDLDLEYGWPGWREAWAVAVLAVRVRQRRDAPPRTLLIGEALRLVALGGLLAEASSTAGWLILLVSGRASNPGPHPYPAWVQIHLAGSLAIITAFVLLLTGTRVAARTLAALAVLPGLFAIGTWNAPWDRLWQTAAVLGPLWVTVGCLFAGFHKLAPSPRPRPWLLAGAAGTAVCLAWVAVPTVASEDWWAQTIFEPGTLRTLVLTVAIVVYLVARGRRGLDPSGSLALALAIGAAVLLAERLEYLTFTVDYARYTGHRLPLAITAALATALAVACAVQAAIAVRALRRARPSLVPA